MKNNLVLLLLLGATLAHSQLPDHIYHSSIRSIKLFKYGDIYSYPVLTLNGGDLMELDFDDMDADAKNCYYTYQLCNSDWMPSELQPFDYIRGFQSTRISTYRYSSISLIKYTHYQAMIPDRNCVPIKSGNYLLKVYLNSDTSQLLFTKRFLIVDNRMSVAARIFQPFNVDLSLSDQRVQVSVSTANSQINALSPQDLKVVVLQNKIWPTAAMVNRPNIFRGNYYEYNDDATSFPSGREWRWVDLRSFRLRGERVQKIIDSADRIDVSVQPDAERKSEVYAYYRDLDGIYTIENQDGNNADWQSDYAYVHFTFVPPGKQAYSGRDIYIFGELTNYSVNDESRMKFNPDKGVYEGTLLLKQGYYDYSYVSVDLRGPANRFSIANTEGNSNSTENAYTVLVYYRQFGGRYDELLGYTMVNSLTTPR